MKNAPIIRLSQVSSQEQKLRKLIGNIPLPSFIDLLFVADLEANARAATKSQVTDAIEDSLQSQPELFHFKTKGILAAASRVDELERGRFRLHFENENLEGIIDGGHNSLAIGRFVLRCVLTECFGEEEAANTVKKIRSWSDLTDALVHYESDIRENKDLLPEALIPIEVIFPAGDDPDSVEYFEDQILIINAARNNNAQLKDTTKANQKGLYDEIKNNIDPAIRDDIEWKSGEGGRIKATDLVALSLIPLSKLEINGVKTLQENPTVMFSSKSQCVKVYNDIMLDEDNNAVSKVEGDIVEIVHPGVKSALHIMSDLPRLYDLIHELFPKSYGYGFGRMRGVKTQGTKEQLREQRKSKEKRYLTKAPQTHFYQNETTHSFGDGFLYPIVVALRELMELNNSGEIVWKTNPDDFIRDNLKTVMDTYKDMISGQDYDPARVGKTKGAYNLVAQAVKHLLDAEELERLRAQMAAK